MQNLVNLNPVDFSSKSAAPNKLSSSPPPAVPFQQMLTKEIAQKSPAPPSKNNNNNASTSNVNKANVSAAPVKQSNINKAPSSPKTEAKPNNTETSNANSAADKVAIADNKTNRVSASTSNDAENASEQVGKLSDSDAIERKEDDIEQVSADQSGNAQLLALVASVGQFVADQSSAAKAFASTKNQVDADTEISGKLTVITIEPDAQLTNKIAADADKLGAATDAKAMDLTQSAQATPEFANALKELQAQSQKGDLNTGKELNPSDTKPSNAQSKDANSDMISDALNTQSPESSKLGNDAKALILQAQTDIKNQTSADTNNTSDTPAIQGVSTAIAMNLQRTAEAATTHLAPHVGTQAWDQAVGQKVVWMVAGGQQSAELTLNPPDLGPLQVVLSINNDQANATFISAQPEVRAALESAMPKLRQMMEDAGISLTGFSVNSQASQGFAFQQNANSFAQQSSQSKQSDHRTNNQMTISSPTITSGTANLRNSSIGGIDLFA